MKCAECGKPLIGFRDTQLRRTRDGSDVICADVAACTVRRDANTRELREAIERAHEEHEPEPPTGPKISTARDRYGWLSL